MKTTADHHLSMLATTSPRQPQRTGAPSTKKHNIITPPLPPNASTLIPEHQATTSHKKKKTNLERVGQARVVEVVAQGRQDEGELLRDVEQPRGPHTVEGEVGGVHHVHGVVEVVVGHARVPPHEEAHRRHEVRERLKGWAGAGGRVRWGGLSRRVFFSLSPVPPGCVFGGGGG